VAARTARRLPGFRFEAQPPPLTEVLPRMDVPVLVGFAASGPLHVPVPVEDPDHFAALFGEDAALAWDAERGEPAHAHLAPSVRAFFRNGGRRCWVVRVAGPARSNAFPLPGLARLRKDGTLAPAFARARSEGSWSDPLQVGTALLSRPLRVSALPLTDPVLVLDPASRKDVDAGDLLRVTFPDAGCLLQFVVGAFPKPGKDQAGTFPVRAGAAVWFQTADRKQPPGGAAQIRTITPDDQEKTFTASVLQWPSAESAPTVQLRVGASLAAAPSPGSLVRVGFGAEVLWLVVADVRAAASDSHAVILSGQGLWQLAGPPPIKAGAPAIVERLTLELWVRRGTGYPLRLSDLGFAADHPRFWGKLPTDAELYADPDATLSALWQAAAEPRFPLAGGGPGLTASFPLVMSVVPDNFQGPVPPAGTPLERDGLADFGARIFLDTRRPEVLRTLVETPAADLLAAADFVRYQGPALIKLQGIHAALDVEEATLIAVPDAVHCGWSFTEPAAAPAPDKPQKPPPAPAGQPGAFLACEGTAPVPAPSTVAGESGQPAVALTLPGGGPDDVLAGGWRLKPEGAYSPDTLLVVQRALLRLCAARGDLSAVLALPEHYREDQALAHVATLTSPAGPRVPVKTLDASPPPGPPPFSLPLSPGETDALSYGAVYHPWLVGREENQPDVLRHVPPDGPACGVLALRALTRGAWVAPANEPLRGVVALNPPLSPDRGLDLYAAQVNVVRQEPHGFVALSADTLSPDESLRPLNVRRLLILLRRLALRLGAAYVFEPNDASFQRSVQRGFEALLEFLYARGAFAGNRPGAAFQVVVGGGLNTPTDVDQGRFFVELRVAPSQPLTFLTVRLVQTGDGGTVTEVP
jgi:hypothetical protein